MHKEGEQYKITQRPSINISEDGSSITGLEAKARGIYYWENNSKIYIVNDDSIYASTQDSVAVGTMSTGTEYVTILETIGTPRLVFLDAENDEGWYMSAAESLTQITDGDFPSTLCHGGAILDTYVFVMDEDGIIYNSASDDPTTWGTIDFTDTERENDKGVYLGKHHDHIVAFGTRTIEFFYDAGNPSGSPLTRRSDVQYNIGAATGLGFWENGDVTYFIGSNWEGQLNLYKLEQFRVTPIGNDTMSSYISQGVLQTGLNFHLSGVTAMGHDILLMTIYELDANDEIVPKQTISYDARSELSGFWTTVANGNAYFPLMAWTKRTGGQNPTVSARYGEGIFSNGDIFNVTDRLVPIDTVGGVSIYEDDIYASGIYASSDGTSENIETRIRTGMQLFGTRTYKFQNCLTLLCENTAATEDMTVAWSDERNDDFTTIGTIDLQYERKELHQGGRFSRRNYQFDYAGDEQIYIDGADADISIGL